MKTYTWQEILQLTFTEPTIIQSFYTRREYVVIPLEGKYVKKRYTNVFITKELFIHNPNKLTIHEGKVYRVHILRKALALLPDFRILKDAKAFAEYIDQFTFTGDHTSQKELYDFYYPLTVTYPRKETFMNYTGEKE
jgi:hypothetical protein